MLAASSTAFAANETINVGVIGTGGRARRLMQSLKEIPTVRMISLCDVWDNAMADAKAMADPKATTTKSYQKLLDDKSIDAVVIGTPDHWHVPMTVAACQAGKDVYVEKPLTHSLAEGAIVMKAQTESKAIVQVGTQQRSMPHIQQAKQLIGEGAIGDVFKVAMTWNRNTDRIRRNALNIDPKSVDWPAFLGNAPKQAFDEYRFRNWRWFWDFGGGIFTDLMVHWVDVAHWILDLDHPTRALSVGDSIAAKEVWQTPDTVQTLLEYPGSIQMHFEGTFSNARERASITFMGPEGSLYIDRGGFILTPEGKSKREPLTRIDGTQPTYRGADFYDKPDGELLHLQNWLSCVKSRKEPTAPVSGGVSSASAAHLANAAMRGGGVENWDGK